MPSPTRFLHFPAALPGGVKTGISLHGHTLHSKESLEFLAGILHTCAPLAWSVRRYQRRRSHRDRDFDFSRLWWTPPLSARQVWELEARRIENELNLAPIVSITDHDTLEAPLALRVLEETGQTPISVEWTVPYENTFFHLGVHNLPIEEAQAMFAGMQAHRSAPSCTGLDAVLSELHSRREVLTVLNHPLWDEKGIGKDSHRQRVREFLERAGGRIHAIEWNGFRSRRENLEVLALSAETGVPVVAGGDRHGRQASSVLSVTAAECFAEFAADVRRRRRTTIVLMPEQREQLRLRVVESICEILREDPNHSLGWRRWTDRVFYRSEGGEVLPLSRIWQGARSPLVVDYFVRLMCLVDAGLGHSPLRSAVRLALASREEAA